MEQSLQLAILNQEIDTASPWRRKCSLHPHKKSVWRIRRMCSPLKETRSQPLLLNDLFLVFLLRFLLAVLAYLIRTFLVCFSGSIVNGCKPSHDFDQRNHQNCKRRKLLLELFLLIFLAMAVPVRLLPTS